MSPSVLRRIAVFSVMLAVLGGPRLAPAQEGGMDAVVEEEETATADKAAPKAEKAPEPPKNAYVLELINVKDFQSTALLRKQLENLLERGAAVVKTQSTWGKLTFDVRTSMAAGEVKNGLMQMQLGETRLKSVSQAGNRFTIEIQ